MSYEELRVYFGGLAESGIWVLPLKALVAACVFGQVLAMQYSLLLGEGEGSLQRLRSS